MTENTKQPVSAPLIGLAVGLATGVVLIIGWFWEALLVLAFGLMGAAGGWVIQSVRARRFDVRGAWSAFRGD